MLTNYHTHTSFCDGKNTAEEMVLSAINQKFDALGFSAHAYSDFATDYCTTDTDAYIKEINRLKAKYQDNLQIYLGLEVDAHAPVKHDRLDYVIGSSHHILKDGKYYSVDESPEGLIECINAFDGDYLKFCEHYYRYFCSFLNTYKPDIIGHFDLITKFDEINESKLLKNSEYQKISQFYLEKAINNNLIFEINTGAISRGYRSSPYPSIDLLKVLKNNGSKIMLSSDSHSIDTLSSSFDDTTQLLKSLGFKTQWILFDNKFTEVDL